MDTEESVAAEKGNADTAIPPERGEASEKIAETKGGEASETESEVEDKEDSDKESEAEDGVETKAKEEKDEAAKKEETNTPVKAPKRKEEIKEDPPVGIAPWVLTFADLMSLLMAFFVLLYSMSEVDEAKFEEFGRSMKEALGKSVPFNADVEKEDNLPILDNKKVREKIAKTSQDVSSLKEILKDQIENKQVEVEQYGQIIIINLLQNGVFNSGSADILAGFKPTVEKISKELKTKIKGEVIVSGHTDNVPVRGGPYDSNWELSAARANAVIQSLMAAGKVKPKRFVLRGYGDTRPKVANTTANNRAKNRRVEILIDQRSVKSKKTDENNKDKRGIDTEEGVAGNEVEVADAGDAAPGADATSSLQATADAVLKNKARV